MAGVLLSRSVNAAPVYIVNSDGQDVNFIQLLSNLALAGSAASADMDTSGGMVPTYKMHAYTYDDSGNLSTDTVTDGSNTWVKTYTYTPSGPATDSGWVKQ